MKTGRDTILRILHDNGKPLTARGVFVILRRRKHHMTPESVAVTLCYLRNSKLVARTAGVCECCGSQRTRYRITEGGREYLARGRMSTEKLSERELEGAARGR